MGPARIYPWRKMRRSRVPSIAPGILCRPTLGGHVPIIAVSLFGATAPLASFKATVDLYDAGGDSGLPCLEYHITDHLWTGLYLWIDFPAPPRRGVSSTSKSTPRCFMIDSCFPLSIPQ